MKNNSRPGRSIRTAAMAQGKRHWVHAIGPACLLIALPLHAAGITVDNTLVKGGTLSGPNYQITSTLGRQLGQNLFFSFSQFNVATGESATFFSPASINNIISRVTGGSASSIDGLIRSETEGTGQISGAAFYFINPAGVIFGPNATVNVGSAFHVSTAHNIRFADDGVFDAANPAASSLSSAPPAAFGFLGGQGAISIQGGSLSLGPGTTLSLIGGDIDINGATLTANGGRINLASVQGAGTVALTGTGITTTNTSLGNISLSNNASVLSDSPADGSLASGPIYVTAGNISIDTSLISATNASNLPGGNIVVQANQLSISGDASGQAFGIFAQTQGLGSGGNINLNVPTISLDTDSGIDTSSFGPGAGGSIFIQTQTLSVSSGASILSNNANGTGSAGNVTINSTGSVTVDGSDVFPSAISADSGDAGAAGNVSLQAPSVIVSNGGVISSDAKANGNGGTVSVQGDTVAVLGGGSIETISLGNGTAGNVQVTATKSITLDGQGSLIAADAKGDGDAGTVSVQAPSVTVSNNGQISSDNYGQGLGGTVSVQADTVAVLGGGTIETISFGDGAAGNVQVTATKSITLDGQGGTSSSMIATDAKGAGDAGSLLVQAPTIALGNGAQISSDTFVSGAGGNVVVQGTDVAVHSGGSIETFTFGSGAAGTVQVTATHSVTVDGGLIAADAKSDGDAGFVSVQAPNVTVSNNGQISSDNYGLGLGGSVSVQADTVAVLSGGTITTQTLGASAAGNVQVIASKSVTVDGGGLIAADALDVGAAGNVMVQAPSVTVSNDGKISSDAYVSSNGGNVSVQGSTIAVLGGGIISANTFGSGAGGNVSVTADQNIMVDGVDGSGTASGILAVSRGTGDGGNISLTAPSISLSNLGQVDVSSYGDGNGGNITLKVGGPLSISGANGQAQSGIFAATFGQGKGGSVSVIAADANITDGGTIFAGSSGIGSGGSIQLQISDALLLLRGGTIDTRTTESDGGNISLQVGRLLYLLQSQITTSVQGGAGNGGNITIDPRYVILNNSSIVANAFGGNGGNISITADHFIPSADSRVQASSQLGIAGTISISSPMVNVGQGLGLLPANYLDASRLLRPGCSAEAGETGNSLVAVGRGGFPPSGRGPAYAGYSASPGTGLAYEPGVLHDGTTRSAVGVPNPLSAYLTCIAYQE